MWPLLACVAVPAPPGSVQGSRGTTPDSSPTSSDATPEPLPGDPSGDADPTDAVFDPTTVHQVHLTLAPEAWADLRDDPWSKNWWPATAQIDDDPALADVGVRAFGAGSLIAGKPSLKIAFDHTVSGQRWRELEQIKLDNSSQDVGFMDERIATQVLRDAGVPAARTGWARVDVNGEDIGVFVLLEAIDDRFLTRWFGEDEGPLYGMISGRWGQGLLPTDTPLDDYEIQTSVLGDGSEIQSAAAALAMGDASAIDTEGFFRESVLRSALGSQDAFSADGNNFYLYVHEGRLTIIPWDFDYDLGTGGVATTLTVDPRAPWNQSPWSYNAVTGADYEDPVLKWNLAHGADPDAVYAELRTTALNWAALDAAIVESRDLILPEVQTDPLGYGAAMPIRVADVRLFVHARLSALFGEEVADCAPPVGTPLSEMHPTGTVGWGSATVDATTYWGPGFSIAGEHVCRGIFAHAPSEITIQVPEGATQLTGLVGLQDWNQVCGDGATFSIEQGGVTVWAGPSRSTYADAVAFTVAIAPGPAVLRATENAEYSCDTAVWGDVEAR